MNANPPAPRVAICAAGEIWGGVEQFVSNDAERLHASGMLALVILFHEARLYARLRQSGVPVVVVRCRSRFDIAAVREIRRLLTAHAVGVLHVHGYKAAILAGLGARLAGVRVVKTEHGRLEPGSGLGQWKMRANLLADRLLAPIVVDGVAFVSRDVQRATRLAYPLAVTRLIHNGIAPEVQIGAPPPPDLDPQCFNVGIVGRVSPVKGHRYLIQALPLLTGVPRLMLHVVGDGPDTRTCIKQCAELGETARVRFHGFRNDARAYLSRFDLLVMPSLHEGLPYTLLEAMSAGVPIVASAVGGLREVLEHRVDGYLVPPRSPGALASAIEELYRDAPLRRCLAANAAAKVAREYSLHQQNESYADLYRAVLGVAG